MSIQMQPQKADNAQVWRASGYLEWCFEKSFYQNQAAKLGIKNLISNSEFKIITNSRLKGLQVNILKDFSAQICRFCASRLFLLLLQKICIMTFDIVIIGYFAGFCTAIAQFPQALKVIRSGETQNISIGTYSIMTFGILMWFLYGILLSNLPMIIANGVCLLPSLYILTITVRNILTVKKQ